MRFRESMQALLASLLVLLEFIYINCIWPLISKSIPPLRLSLGTHSQQLMPLVQLWHDRSTNSMGPYATCYEQVLALVLKLVYPKLQTLASVVHRNIILARLAEKTIRFLQGCTRRLLLYGRCCTTR